jgi:hypothetical protein
MQQVVYKLGRRERDHSWSTVPPISTIGALLQNDGCFTIVFATVSLVVGIQLLVIMWCRAEQLEGELAWMRPPTASASISSRPLFITAMYATSMAVLPTLVGQGSVSVSCALWLHSSLVVATLLSVHAYQMVHIIGLLVLAQGLSDNYPTVLSPLLPISLPKPTASKGGSSSASPLMKMGQMQRAALRRWAALYSALFICAVLCGLTWQIKGGSLQGAGLANKWEYIYVFATLCYFLPFSWHFSIDAAA